MASVFCSIDVPHWVIKECGVERAGIIALGLIDVDEAPTSLNLESKAYWTGRIGASPQQFFLVQPTRGEYPGGTPTEEEGFGMESVQITGADHTSTLETEGLYDNWAFWEGVNRKKWKTVFFTAADLMYYNDQPATVYGKVSNQKSVKGGAFWTILIKWQALSNPRVLNTPSGLLADVG